MFLPAFSSLIFPYLLSMYNETDITLSTAMIHDARMKICYSIYEFCIKEKVTEFRTHRTARIDVLSGSM